MDNIELTPDEKTTLDDLCRRVNYNMHEKMLYVALYQKGLVVQRIYGDWRPTEAGLELNEQLNPRWLSY